MLAPPGREKLTGNSGRSHPLRLSSDRDGRFEGVLPEQERWRISVEAEEPKVVRTLQDVKVEVVGSGGLAHLEIDLPATRLEGRVLDAEGDPTLASVLLYVHGEQVPPEQARTEKDGRFSFSELDSDTYTLQAFALGGGSASPPQEVQISGDQDPEPVELRLSGERRFLGRVVAGSRGVPGALVLATPKGGSEQLSTLVPRSQTNVEGDFELALPRAAELAELVVLPPGFTLTTATVPIGEGDVPPLLLPAHSAGGTIFVTAGPGFDPDQAPWRLSVAREGVEIGYPTLLRWARIEGGGWSEDQRLLLPRMAFGDYTVCLNGGASPGCQNGYLAPGSELRLDFPREAHEE